MFFHFLTHQRNSLYFRWMWECKATDNYKSESSFNLNAFLRSRNPSLVLLLSIVLNINFAGRRRTEIVWLLALKPVTFTGFICSWLMLGSGMNTFCLCLEKEIRLCALPYIKVQNTGLLLPENWKEKKLKTVRKWACVFSIPKAYCTRLSRS